MEIGRKAFLEAKRLEINRRGLMAYPKVTAEEIAGAEAMGNIMANMSEPLRLEHPHFHLKVELPAIVAPRLAYLISIGDYEQVDLEVIAEFVQEGDRVLDIGGGVGLTAALAASHSKAPVTVIEADKRLQPVIERQVSLNGGECCVVPRCVVSDGDTPDRVDFTLADEFWFSRVLPSTERRQGNVVSVETIGLTALIKDYAPDVLIVDVEGSEQGLFVAPLRVRPRIVAIEIHYPLLGTRDATAVIQRIIDEGYRFVLLKGWTHVFERRATA